MNDAKFIYLFLESSYLKLNGRTISYGNSNNDLFPFEWHSILNYEFKIQVLKEALEKNIKIIDTECYQSAIEGVKRRF